ncbi:hypothetical protein MPSEU_000851800 [Mayamaea pseudoterrestris]|nr:hypothetical protein MPSEU_000851800 [Mayamaea pseudoterrestris]
MCWNKVLCMLLSVAVVTALSASRRDFSKLFRATRKEQLPPQQPATTTTDSKEGASTNTQHRTTLTSRHSRQSFLLRASTAAILIATSSIISQPSVYAAAASSTSIPLPRRREQTLNFPFYKFQFETVADVPKSYFVEQRSVYALVERVIDGDTIRVRHVPFFGLTGRKPSPLTTRGIADQTMSIRIYGVDCPEIAKSGKAGQPFAEEAKEFTSNLLLHQMVKITFLRRDQYGRAVSAVETVSPFWKFGLGKKDLSMELAREGLAELYTGGGAEYFDKRIVLEKKIAKAQAKKTGIWSQGKKRTSAADFKRNQDAEPVPLASAKNKKTIIDKRNNVLQVSNAHNQRATPAVADKRSSKLMDAAVTGLEFVS